MKYDELLKILRECNDCRCEEHCPYHEERNNPLRCMTKIVGDAADAIEGLQSQLPKWISVTERLPDRPGSFLCTVYGDSIGENYVTICDYSCRPWHAVTGWFCHAGQRYLEDVTNDVIAWMPLPKPLEEETDG